MNADGVAIERTIPQVANRLQLSSRDESWWWICCIILPLLSLLRSRITDLYRQRQQASAPSLRFGRHYCSLVYSAFACFRMGMSGSASFQRAKKSL